MKRRTFMTTALGAAMSVKTFARNVFIRGKDVSYEPDQPLESTGLNIREGVKLLKKGEKGNTVPVLREEILENPDAVFFIYADVKDRHNWGGRWNPRPGRGGKSCWRPACWPASRRRRPRGRSGLLR